MRIVNVCVLGFVALGAVACAPKEAATAQDEQRTDQSDERADLARKQKEDRADLKADQSKKSADDQADAAKQSADLDANKKKLDASIVETLAKVDARVTVLTPKIHSAKPVAHSRATSLLKLVNEQRAKLDTDKADLRGVTSEKWEEMKKFLEQESTILTNNVDELEKLLAT